MFRPKKQNKMHPIGNLGFGPMLLINFRAHWSATPSFSEATRGVFELSRSLPNLEEWLLCLYKNRELTLLRNRLRIGEGDRDLDTRISLISVLVLFLVIPSVIGYGVGRSRSNWGRDGDRLAFVAGALGFILWANVGTKLYSLTEYGGFGFVGIALMGWPFYAFAFGSISVHTARLFFRMKR